MSDPLTPGQGSALTPEQRSESVIEWNGDMEVTVHDEHGATVYHFAPEMAAALASRLRRVIAREIREARAAGMDDAAAILDPACRLESTSWATHQLGAILCSHKIRGKAAALRGDR